MFLDTLVVILDEILGIFNFLAAFSGGLLATLGDVRAKIEMEAKLREYSDPFRHICSLIRFSGQFGHFFGVRTKGRKVQKVV